MKSDTIHSLHSGRQAGQHVRVCDQLGQPEDGQRRKATAQRALDGVRVGRLDVDAGQALQTERVPALKHLGAAEDVVELTEADGALEVRVAVRGERRPTQVWGQDDDGHLVGRRSGWGRVQNCVGDVACPGDWRGR